MSDFMINTRERAVEVFRSQVAFCLGEAAEMEPGQTRSHWLGMAAGYKLSADLIEDTWTALKERVHAREAK